MKGWQTLFFRVSKTVQVVDDLERTVLVLGPALGGENEKK
jgi:hypothetical protein